MAEACWGWTTGPEPHMSPYVRLAIAALCLGLMLVTPQARGRWLVRVWIVLLIVTAVGVNLWR